MRTQFYFALVLGLMFSFSAVTVAQEAAQQETQQDEKTTEFLKKVMGTWKPEKLAMGDNAPPEGLIESMAFIFSEDKLVVLGMQGPNSSLDCEYKFDASETPITFKFKPKTETEWMTGIAKVEEGKFHMCMVPPGLGGQPTKFEKEGEDGTPRMLGVFAKSKEKAESEDDK